MALPVLTTAEDVRDLISYLKTKPTGATIAEAKAAIKKSVLDGRKFTAYTLWGFVTKEGERIKLTQRGWDYARKPDSEQEIYRRVIDSIPPYKSVLEWSFHQKMDAITNVDVAAHWHEHHKEVLGTDNEDTIKNTAVCFFHIAQAAGLGTWRRIAGYAALRQSAAWCVCDPITATSEPDWPDHRRAASPRGHRAACSRRRYAGWDTYSRYQTLPV